MNAIASTQSTAIERADFIEILNDEFTVAQGFGTYAYLSYGDIDALYQQFLHNTKPARAYIRIFVKQFSLYTV